MCGLCVVARVGARVDVLVAVTMYTIVGCCDCYWGFTNILVVYATTVQLYIHLFLLFTHPPLVSICLSGESVASLSQSQMIENRASMRYTC